MKLLLAITLLIVIAVLGSRFTFFSRRLSMGFKNILLTGTEYLFIGVILGKMGLNIFDGDALVKMEPFLILGLCWIGLLFGLQFQVRQLKKLPLFYFSISAMQALVTFIVVSGSCYMIFNTMGIFSGNTLLINSLVLGSAASCTAQAVLALVNKSHNFRNRRNLVLLRYISGIDGIYALIFFTFSISIIPGIKDSSGFDILSSAQWLGISVLIGIIPAIVFILLSRIRITNPELFLFIIATIAFAGGFAAQTRYSPLISGLIAGFIIANFGRNQPRVLSEVLYAEKSIYIILLLILGAGWEFKNISAVVIGIGYILLRIAGKVAGTYLGIQISNPGFKIPLNLGFGLISEGGHAIAIIISFKLLFPEISDILVTIIIISVFINELISPWLLISQLDRIRIKENSQDE